MNKQASEYASMLFGAPVPIQLSATRQLKSRKATKEELSIKAEIPGCSDVYAGASKGQKRRLDVALVLAFREIVARRSSRACDQFFVDELFDGLDASGCETVVELLRTVAGGAPVILITHDPKLKAVADRVIHVHHTDGIARVA